MFALDGGMRLAGFATTGLYTAQSLQLAAVGLPFLALGLYAGGHVHTSLQQHHFVRIVAAVLLVSGVGLLLKG